MTERNIAIPDRPNWSFGVLVRGSDPDGTWTDVPLNFELPGGVQAKSFVMRMPGSPDFVTEILPAAQAQIDEWERN